MKSRNTNEHAVDRIQYMAKKNLKLLMKPYPAVQSGGISAVAMATPGMDFLFLLLSAIAPNFQKRQ
jgi:hypothetical protein